MKVGKKAVCIFALAVLSAGVGRAVEGSGYIQRGSKVFIEPMDGFEVYIAAALEKKNVPVIIVTDKSRADLVISGTSESQKAGWAKMLLTRSAQSHEEASIVVKDARTGDVVFAYAVNKGNSVHGKQSTAEACAKHLKGFIEKGK